MRRQISLFVSVFILLSVSYCAASQQNITIVTQNSRIADGLDLYAVAELFKDSENLEEFERALNDPELGINNLDLDGDGYVDYIRVVEQAVNDIRIVILQVALGHDEFQDVATIEVERTGINHYNVQIRGNEVIYGVDYYITPVYVHVQHIHRWRIIPWMYRPMYRPYYSVFYFGYYPVWWRPYRPVVIHVYHHRTERYRERATFEHSREGRFEPSRETNYQPRTSPRVRERVQAIGPTPAPERIVRQSSPGEQPPAVEKRTITRNSDINKTTNRGDEARVAKPLPRNATNNNRGTERITKPQPQRRANETTDTRKIAKPQTPKNAAVKRESGTIIKQNSENRPVSSSKAKKVTAPKPERKISAPNEARKISKPKPVNNPPVKKESKQSTTKEKNKKLDMRK